MIIFLKTSESDINNLKETLKTQISQMDNQVNKFLKISLT